MDTETEKFQKIIREGMRGETIKAGLAALAAMFLAGSLCVLMAGVIAVVMGVWLSVVWHLFRYGWVLIRNLF